MWSCRGEDRNGCLAWLRSGRTFKACLLRDVERRVLPRNGVLSIAPVRCPHLVEGSDAVSRLELDHPRADRMDNARDVITLVANPAAVVRCLPVLRVRAADNDFDEDLIGGGVRDGRVDYLDPRT